MRKLCFGAMGRGEAPPSELLRDLCALGASVRFARRMALCAGDRHVMDMCERLAETRAQAYDESLTVALGYVAEIRARRGQTDAEIVEARFVDGESWAVVARRGEASCSEAVARADRALKWLDRRHGAA